MERRTKISYKNTYSGCLVLFLIGFLQLFIFVFFFMGFDDYFLPNPPEPETHSGEFQFEIVYAINGKQYILSDIFVCKYQGVKIHGGGVLGGKGEKRRLWTGYIKSTGEKELILYKDDKIKLYCELGAPGYYMGDKNYADDSEAKIYLEDSKRKFNYTLEKENMTELYDTEIISFKISEPIENEFRYTIKSIFAWPKQLQIRLPLIKKQFYSTLHLLTLKHMA